MAYNFQSFDGQIDKSVEWLHGEFKSIQTGMATPSVLDNIRIEAYGSLMEISHVAAINIEDAKTLRVSAYDKSQLKDLEEAINKADLGLSVANDGEGLRVMFPMLTTERRVQYVKIAKDRLEEAKVRIRMAREDAKKEIERGGKDSEYGKDEEKRYLDTLQAKMDSANLSLSLAFEHKENEIMK